MQFVAVVDQNPDSGHYVINWYGKHFSNGYKAIGRNPIECLENLAEHLKRADERMAGILGSEGGDD